MKKKNKKAISKLILSLLVVICVSSTGYYIYNSNDISGIISESSLNCQRQCS